MKAKTNALRKFVKAVEKMAAPELTLEQKLARAYELKQQLDAVKTLYRERDQLVAELVKQKEFLASKGVKPIDNFKGKTYVVKPCVISRWDLEFPKVKAGKV